jgi:hypothetical protein
VLAAQAGGFNTQDQTAHTAYVNGATFATERQPNMIGFTEYSAAVSPGPGAPGA